MMYYNCGCTEPQGLAGQCENSVFLMTAGFVFAFGLVLIGITMVFFQIFISLHLHLICSIYFSISNDMHIRVEHNSELKNEEAFTEFKDIQHRQCILGNKFFLHPPTKVLY